jgi:hypothetical protein
MIGLEVEVLFYYIVTGKREYNRSDKLSLQRTANDHYLTNSCSLEAATSCALQTMGWGIPHVHEALISVSSWDRVVYLFRPKQLVDVHFGRGVPHTQKLDPILNPSVSSKMLFTPSGVLGIVSVTL